MRCFGWKMCVILISGLRSLIVLRMSLAEQSPGERLSAYRHDCGSAVDAPRWRNRKLFVLNHFERTTANGKTSTLGLLTNGVTSQSVTQSVPFPELIPVVLPKTQSMPADQILKGGLFHMSHQ